MTVFPEWQPSEGALGEVEFYYPQYPAGHRAAWSCRWITRGERGNVVMLPREWGYGDPGLMSQLELYCELADLAARTPDPSAGLAGRLIASVGPTLDFSGVVSLENTIRNKLNNWREAYPEYLASWEGAVPAKAFTNGRVILQTRAVWRPGWGGPVEFGDPIPLPEPARVNPDALSLGG